MKRLLSGLLSVIMLIGLCAAMSGCGKSESDTLVWYVPGDSQKDMAAVMEAANKIIEPKLGVKLDLKMLDTGAYSEKMSMMVSANEKIDICFTGYVNPYVSAVRLGAYYPMKELLDKYAPKLKEEIPDYVWNVAYVDDEIYAVPNMQIMTNIEGVFFFEDVANKYGITSDMTYKDVEELEPIMEKIKNGESDMYPITNLPTTTFYRDYYLIHQSPFMYISKDTKKVSAMTEMSEYQDALETARKWYEKGYIRSDIDTAASHKEEDLRAGKYASFGGRWKPGIEQDHEKMYGKKTVFVSSGISELFGGLDTMTAISKTSKNPEKAMQLIELVNTDKELYNIICYGIEGKHYEKLDGDYIRPIENSGYSQLACWKFGIKVSQAQIDLLKKFRRRVKKLVTVVFGGRALGLEEVSELSDAVLYAWHSGVTAGKSAAKILFGDVVPSGKTPVSFLHSSGQIPMYYNMPHLPIPAKDESVPLYYGEPIFPSYKDEYSKPLYPFGYGLSYTEFSYDDIKADTYSITADELENGNAINISLKVSNIGNVDGKEVVQMYIHAKKSSVMRPMRELKGFEKVMIKNGECTEVSFKLSKKELGYYVDRKLIVEKGKFDIYVGSSSYADNHIVIEII